MAKTSFKKEINCIGPNGTVYATIIATMNYERKKINSTHAITHDDQTRTIPLHMVESYINGALWKKFEKIDSETALFNESKRIIDETMERLVVLANEKPVVTFENKMDELFKSDIKHAI